MLTSVSTAGQRKPVFPVFIHKRIPHFSFPQQTCTRTYAVKKSMRLFYFYTKGFWRAFQYLTLAYPLASNHKQITTKEERQPKKILCNRRLAALKCFSFTHQIPCVFHQPFIQITFQLTVLPNANQTPMLGINLALKDQSLNEYYQAGYQQITLLLLRMCDRNLLSCDWSNRNGGHRPTQKQNSGL